MQTIDERIIIYNRSINIFEDYKDITSAHSGQIKNINDYVGNIQKKVESIKTHNGTLRVGIVGQVKAGKSSFINALLFDGISILPKASTPMTAALTLMTYSEKPYAEVEFYTEEDWEIIRVKAKEYEDMIKSVEQSHKGVLKKKLPDPNVVKAEAEQQLSEEVKAAHELFHQAAINKVNVDEYLGKRKKITVDQSDSTSDLMDRLTEYVGAGGKYTPFTRNTKLYLDIPSLKGIELVDTPGVNDPVISRGMITRQYLAKCDVVFLLSYAGQFMGQEDTSFLINTLPNEGIRKVFLIGSKFDSVLLDESKKYKFLQDAVKDIYSKLIIQAKDTVLPQIQANSEIPLMKALQESLPPTFISGICYSIAAKSLQNLDVMEQHILNRLRDAYPNDTFDKKWLLDISHISTIKDDNLPAIQAQKQEILSNRLQDLIDGQNRGYLDLTTDLITSIKKQLEKISSANVEDLENQYKETLAGLSKAEGDIKQEFFELNLEIRKEIRSILLDLKNSRSDHKKLEVEEKDEVVGTERHGFMWLKKRDVWGVVSYASVYDAIDSITKYINKVNSLIAKKWETIIKLDVLEGNILRIIINCLDTSSENYDKDNIIRPLKNAISEIIIEPYDADSAKYEKRIRSNFSGTTVKGYETDLLQGTLIDTVNDIFDDLKVELKRQESRLVKTLETNGKKFVETISSQANKEIDELKKQIKDRKHSIARNESLITELEECISGLK